MQVTWDKNGVPHQVEQIEFGSKRQLLKSIEMPAAAKDI